VSVHRSIGTEVLKSIRRRSETFVFPVLPGDATQEAVTGGGFPVMGTAGYSHLKRLHHYAIRVSVLVGDWIMHSEIERVKAILFIQRTVSISRGRWLKAARFVPLLGES